MTGMEEMILWENPPDRIIQSKALVKRLRGKDNYSEGEIRNIWVLF